MAFAVVFALAGALLAATAVNAESHQVTFDNQCGYGTPTLIVGGQIVSTGQPYTSNGPISSSIAYLQTGACLFNGEGCTLVELTLTNPNGPGTGSSSDLSLITPHAFSVTTSFAYTNGCSNGASCDSESCPDAFHTPTDTWVQQSCQVDNAGLVISFCSGGSGSSGNSAVVATSTTDSTPSSSSSSYVPTSTSSSTSSTSTSTSTSTTSTSTSSTVSATATESAKTCSSKRRRRSDVKRMPEPVVERTEEKRYAALYNIDELVARRSDLGRRIPARHRHRQVNH